MRKSRTGFGLSAIPAVFIAWFFVYPFTTILWTGFVAGKPRLHGVGRLVGFTVGQALASTIVVAIVALPLTAVISNFDFPGRATVRTLVTVPFVLPTTVVAAAFLALGLSGSLIAIIAAHVFFNVAVVVRGVGAIWARLDRANYEAARTLGARRFVAFSHTTFPSIRPALLSSLGIVFLLCFTSFGVVLILGELRYRTIEVEIYQRAVTFLDLPTAAALTLIQAAAVVILVGLQSVASRRTSRQVPARHRLRPWEGHKTLVTMVVGLTVGGLAVPPAALVARSLRGNGAGWRFLLDPGYSAIRPLEALANSLVFAVLTTIAALTIGGLAAWAIARQAKLRVLDLTLMLPLGTSAVTIGLGFLVALDRPIDLRTSWIIIPIAHTLVAIPFVIRAAVPAISAVRADLKEAAAVLGASPFAVWRHVELPMVARSLGVGAGLAAAISLGEFGATSFITRPDFATVPTLLFRLLSRPGSVSYSGAMALAVLLMGLTATVMVIADETSIGEVGTF